MCRVMYNKYVVLGVTITDIMSNKTIAIVRTTVKFHIL